MTDTVAAAEPPLRRRLAAEGLGAFLLFAAVIGSGIMAERLAGGNVALALLANTLATGAVLFVLVAILGPVSGAHMNPAVTLVAALRQWLGPREAALYVLAQLAFGIAGAWAAHLMFDLPVIQYSARIRTGLGQWLGEGIATFGLLLTIIGTARHRPHWMPATVSLWIVAAYWFTSSTSFANPAITIARTLSDSFAGIAPANAAAFIAAQLAGALLASLSATFLFPTVPDNRG
jgi:glycerol uptake facilitator-like aquaporin